MRKEGHSALSLRFPCRILPISALSLVLGFSSSTLAQEGKAPPTPSPSTPGPGGATPPAKAPEDKAPQKQAEPEQTKPSEGNTAQDSTGQSAEDSPAAGETSAQPAKEGEEVEVVTEQEVDVVVDEAPTGTTEPSDQAGRSVGTAAAGEASDAALGFGAYPNPADDKEDLEKQGQERPKDVQADRVFAEDWWTHTRPTIEMHGNFRVRANLYHNFSFNRVDAPEAALWPRPLDDYYEDLNGNFHGSQTCTPKEAGTGSSDSPADANQGCFSPTQGGADLRFRIEPDIIISDNLRIRSQIDLLGNLVMGSTAQGYSNFPAATGGYAVSQRSGYYPVSGASNTQASPVSGINSVQDAVSVRRAWAEYDTPVGQLKFGRMPDNFGLGINYNAGDDIDGDYQSTADRIAFITGLPSLFLYVAGAWDFQDEGPTSDGFIPPGGQPYDLSQRDDVSRINLMLFRRMDAQLERLALKKGKVVVNGGMYLSYRWQRLANDYSGPSATCDAGANALDCQAGQAAAGIVRRGMKIWTPDFFAELKYKGFYTGFELVTNQGKFDSLSTTPDSNDYPDVGGWRVSQWGFAGEIEQRLVENRLKLGFYYGWASGDPDVNSLVPTGNPEDQIDDNKLQTFRFHPGYRIDLILNRNILSRVQGSYYFKPAAEYDFIRKASGMRLGGRAEAIWTRASQFMQTPGHARDLGIELDATVYYQSSDGSLNDRGDLKGGFYSMLQYGIAFPLAGLGYQADQTANVLDTNNLKLKPAQMVRGFLGVAF